MIEYWFMFPIAVVFSSIAMATGIGGAAMFTPFFYLIMKIPAYLSVGAGLILEVFGFGSGVWGFASKELIDYKIASYMLTFTVPSAIFGVWLGRQIPDDIVMGVLAIVLFILGIAILKPDTITTIKHHFHHDKKDAHWKHKRDKAVGFLSLLGGLLAGMISTGVGEINDYSLLKKCRMHGAIAAGTSVLVVAVTVLAGSLAHLYGMLIGSFRFYNINSVLAMLAFAVPGVLIGSQLGVKAAQKLTDDHRELLIGILFIALSAVTSASVILR